MDSVPTINLPVYTRSGNYLGRIVDLEINAESYRVEKILVKSSNTFKNLFQGRLIIDVSQIVSVSKDKMVVKDNLKEIERLVSDLVS